MKRKIIRIDEEKCNGCGECITECAEGALQLVDGKARLAKELFCDGFGDCIGKCPTGALRIEEREADAFDLRAAIDHVGDTIGEAGVQRLRSAHDRHALRLRRGDVPAKTHAGCPGTRMRIVETSGDTPACPTTAKDGTAQAIRSELRQWPVQIHLVQPQAPFFMGKELVVMSTCGPLASADLHWRFIRGRAVVVGCPKLDDTSGYAGKLASILSFNQTPRVLVVRMEVPCCGGLTEIVRQAAEMSGRTSVGIEEVFVGITGDIQRVASHQ